MFSNVNINVSGDVVVSDNNDLTAFQAGIYVGFTIFINIINLNLLISIIGIQLDDLQVKQKRQNH